MTYELKEIGQRLYALREINDITAEDMAQKLGMDVDEYLKCESGDSDFSYSFILNAAKVLDIDVLEIISGVSPKLSNCTIVKKGKGFPINRNTGNDYKHLAYTFRSAKADPLLVTVTPNDKPPVMHDHEGQEFNYILHGQMKFYIGENVHELNKGDSVFFDSSIPHCEKAVGDRDLQFLAIVLK